jgi:hypothetical protein
MRAMREAKVAKEASAPPLQDSKPKKRVHYKISRRIKGVKVELMYKRAYTVLIREIDRMLDKSFKEELQPQQGKLLLEYLKFLQDEKASKEVEKLKAATD